MKPEKKRKKRKKFFLHDDEIWNHKEKLSVLKHKQSANHTLPRADLRFLGNDTFLHTDPHPQSLMAVMGIFYLERCCTWMVSGGGSSLILANLSSSPYCVACTGMKWNMGWMSGVGKNPMCVTCEGSGHQTTQDGCVIAKLGVKNNVHSKSRSIFIKIRRQGRQPKSWKKPWMTDCRVASIFVLLSGTSVLSDILTLSEKSLPRSLDVDVDGISIRKLAITHEHDTSSPSRRQHLCWCAAPLVSLHQLLNCFSLSYMYILLRYGR